MTRSGSPWSVVVDQEEFLEMAPAREREAAVEPEVESAAGEVPAARSAEEVPAARSSSPAPSILSTLSARSAQAAERRMDAAFADMLDATIRWSLASMIAACVCLSRVKTPQSIVVMQAFLHFCSRKARPLDRQG